MIQPIEADLRGRVAVVTGATSGIGHEIARDLTSLGAEVVLAVRDPKRGEAVCAELAQATGNTRLRVAEVDFSSQRSIRTFADELLRSTPRIHILVNNAGAWIERKQHSADGIELTWATNVLGYFLTTELLRARLVESAPARVVSVASGYAFGLDLEDVEFERRAYSGSAAYAQSKQANRMWTWALARRLAGSGVTANALHPGAVATQLLRSGFGMSSGRTPAEGADTASWLAAAREVEGVSGKFWMDRRERRCEFRDEREEERLWELCDQMTAPR